jgi:RNA polymerase sigma factor (sigma-70 family)
MTEMQEWSGRLVARWRQGDQDAARELFERYADRLIALARGRLSTRLAQRIDPEDVVQSVYRSFFADTREGRYHLERGGDLWRLLVTITLHKLSDQVRHNSSQKRAAQREQQLGSGPTHLQAHLLAQGPTPLEAALLSDELEHIMASLDPRERRILQARLQGCTLDEIAAQVGCGERTVRYFLKEIAQQIARRNRLEEE